MASSSSSADAPPTLESDVSALLAALRRNTNDDTWAGKPQQESFRVYPQPLSQPSPVADAQHEENTLNATNTVHAPPADSSSSVGGTEEKTESAALRGSLDALMSEYVTAVRGLRKSEGTNDAPQSDARASTSVDKRQATEGGGADETEAVRGGVAAAVVDEGDLQSLLDALDCLPALTKAHNA